MNKIYELFNARKLKAQFELLSQLNHEIPLNVLAVIEMTCQKAVIEKMEAFIFGDQNDQYVLYSTTNGAHALIAHTLGIDCHTAKGGYLVVSTDHSHAAFYLINGQRIILERRFLFGKESVDDCFFTFEEYLSPRVMPTQRDFA